MSPSDRSPAPLDLMEFGLPATGREAVLLAEVRRLRAIIEGVAAKRIFLTDEAFLKALDEDWPDDEAENESRTGASE